MNGVRLEDMLPIIESGKPVSLTFVSYDKRRKTGGKIKQMVGIITKTKSQRLPSSDAKVKTSKKANHFDNFTRNFYTCINNEQTQNIQTVHLPLLLEVDGKTIML